MSRFSVAERRDTLAEIWQFYSDDQDALLRYRNFIKDSLGNPVNPPNEFFGLTLTEVDERFNRYQEQLEHMVGLRLLAAAEAHFQVDFIFRTREKRKDPISKAMSRLKKSQRDSRVKLDEIVKIWRENKPDRRKRLDEFSSLLEQRHWLAHGSYWTPKFGRIKTPEEIFHIVDDLVTTAL